VTRSKDKRQHPRRARSLRFTFEHDGEEHFAVSTIVSIGGAFLKASRPPRHGTLITLRERFSPSNRPVVIRAEVVWTSHAPTLERPDTGLGVRFIEATTDGDPGQLEDFLRGLDPGFDGAGIDYEERPSGALAVYRFDTAPTRHDFTSDDPAAAHFDEAVDLDAGVSDDTRREPRVSPWRAPPTSPSEPRPPTPAPTQRAPAKGMTGIFTSLFRRVGRKDLPAESVEPTPAVAPPSAASETEIRLTWGALRTEARLESIGPQTATLSAVAPLPAVGTAVLMKPLGLPLALADLTISAVVTARDDRGRHPTLALTFVRTDEAQAARILAYVAHAAARLGPAR
jgi:hypothetical protein